MGRLFIMIDRYVQTMNLAKFSLAKICILSTGVVLGLSIVERKRKAALTFATAIFTLTYIPLMMDFLKSASYIDEEIHL